MPRKASGAVKVGTVREKQKNGDIYIYERKTKYDPNKGYSITISKTLYSLTKLTADVMQPDFWPDSDMSMCFHIPSLSHRITVFFLRSIERLVP